MSMGNGTTRCLAAMAVLLGSMMSAKAAVLTVGPGQTFSTVSAAVSAAHANDIINIQAGTYTNDFPVINVPLTINGVGGIAVLQATGPIPNQKGILLVNATASLSNLEFKGAIVTDSDGGNGAGIRHQGGNLTIDKCIFLENQDGILANPIAGASILIDHSTFTNNGSGTGQTHAVYVNSMASLTVQNSTFNGTRVGHDIKSRAAVTVVANNYLDDGVTGTASYAIDVPNGGLATIRGNQIVQGPSTQNPAMIEYGAEGETYGTNGLTVSDNVLTNTFPGNSVGVFNHTSDVAAHLAGNIVSNITSLLIGPGDVDPASTVKRGPIYASILPGARSVRVGDRATVFATILNAGTNSVANCSIALPASASPGLSLSSQTTDPATNLANGVANSPAAIAAGGAQSFILTFQSNAPLSLQAQPLLASCDGTSAPVVVGVNTVDLSFSSGPVADIIALLATVSNDGILTASVGSAAAFAVASINVGTADNLVVKVDTGGVGLPLAATICPTDPVSAQCRTSPAQTVPYSFPAGAAPTFSIFVTASDAISFAPATARIFVRFLDAGGASHGSTSLAVRTN